jgi:hypothetical protein
LCNDGCCIQTPERQTRHNADGEGCFAHFPTLYAIRG